MKNLDHKDTTRSDDRTRVHNRARMLVTLLGPELCNSLQHRDPFFKSLLTRAVSEEAVQDPKLASRAEDPGVALAALVATLDGAPQVQSTTSTFEAGTLNASSTKSPPLWASDLAESRNEHPAIVSQLLANLTEKDRSARIGRLSPRLARQVLRLLIDDI